MGCWTWRRTGGGDRGGERARRSVDGEDVVGERDDEKITDGDEFRNSVRRVRETTRGGVTRGFVEDGGGGAASVPERVEIIKEKCGRDVVELLPRDDIFQPHDWQRRLPTPERIVAAAAYAAGKIRAQLPPINASALLARFVRNSIWTRRGRRRSTRVVALSVPGASVRVKTRRGDAGIDVVRLLGGDVEISVRFRQEGDDDKRRLSSASPTGEE